MNLVENILLALSSLRANKMRALLTMLGIIIGIGSVIAIFTLGDSLTNSISGDMQGMGVNNVTLYLQPKGEQTSTLRQTVRSMNASANVMNEKDYMTDEMLLALQEEFSDEIEAISLSNSVGVGQTTSGKKYANLSLLGINQGYSLANNVTLKEGRFFNERDEDGSKKVAVVSDKLVQNMFADESALGKQITITVNGHVGVYTIVGVYQFENNMMNVGAAAADKDISTSVYIPLVTAQKITRISGYQNITVLTTTTADSKTIAQRFSGFFDKYYSRNPDYRVNAFSMESMLETVTNMLNTVSLAIASIAAISLLVGGIGVMNIMLVSITERTREIGTRKAIGATNGEIRTQFIVEAMIICLIGGAIGIALGIMLGAAGAALLGAPATPSIPTILLTTAFSMLIGVFFGYYPANKAAKLDPIDALRYE